MSDPTFRLDDDGKHVLWEHDHTTSWGGIVRAPVRIPINAERGWTVVSTDPITITPSILCGLPSCRVHGWIREGQWVPA